LAIHLDYYCADDVLVLWRRSGHHHTQEIIRSDAASKWLVFWHPTALRKRLVMSQTSTRRSLHIGSRRSLPRHLRQTCWVQVSTRSAWAVAALLLTWFCLGLLAYRIWTLESKVSGLRATRSPMVHILRVVMDAAILYSVTLFIALVCFILSNNGELVMLYVVITLLILLIRYYWASIN
jgi:hypothetical protein